MATFPCDLGRGGPLAGPPPTRPGASSPWPLPSQAGKPRSFLGPSSSPHSCCTGSVRLGGDPSGCQWEESWVGAVTPPVGKWTRGSRNGISPKPCSGSRGEDERGRGFGGKKRGAWPDGPPRACVGTVRGELLCAVRRYRDHPLSTNVDMPGRAGGLASPGLRSGGPRAHSLGWLQPPRGPATPPSPLSTGPRTHTQLLALTQLATRRHTRPHDQPRTTAHTRAHLPSLPEPRGLPRPALAARANKTPPQPARRAPDPSPNPTVKSQCKQACGLFLCRIFFSRHSLFSFSFYSKHCKYRNIFSVQ